jgi:hypothetical protein
MLRYTYIACLVSVLVFLFFVSTRLGKMESLFFRICTVFKFWKLKKVLRSTNEVVLVVQVRRTLVTKQSAAHNLTGILTVTNIVVLFFLACGRPYVALPCFNNVPAHDVAE